MPPPQEHSTLYTTQHTHTPHEKTSASSRFGQNRPRARTSAPPADPQALSIMRRMPPNKIEQNLSALLTLIPEHTDELLQRVDQPLEVAKCGESGREYLLCDYNRDGDS